MTCTFSFPCTSCERGWLASLIFLAFAPSLFLLSAKSLLPLQDPVLVCKLQVELSWTIASDVYGWGIRPQWSIGHALMVRERYAWDAQCTYLRMHVLLRRVVRF